MKRPFYIKIMFNIYFRRMRNINLVNLICECEQGIKVISVAKSFVKKFGYIRAFFLVILLVILCYLWFPKSKKTVYEFYNIGRGENEGLVVNGQRFLLNGRPLVITCGLIHYCRVHPHHWRDRLRKLRATGAIAVKTTIPWNLHEPYKDIYDFGNQNFDMSQFLDIVKFIDMAKEEDLLVIVSLGPYVNAELDFGGLPSYLLGDGVKVRTSDPEYLHRVEKYFSELLPLLVPLQIKNGGPIIMFQLENSYGSIRFTEIDKKYLISLKNIIRKKGIEALLFTSDSVSASLDRGSLAEQGVLQVVNSETDVLSQLETLKSLQPDAPAFIHLQTGALDMWDWPRHNILPAHEYVAALTEAIQFPASVCLYVFHGGTNFGFLGGAACGDTPDSYHPYTTSSDFDALLSEAGDYLPKYFNTLEILRSVHPLLFHPPPPPHYRRTLSLSLPLTHELAWSDIIRQLPENVINSGQFVHLEDLPPVDGKKQSFGYVKYSFYINVFKRHFKLQLVGRKRDAVMVLLDGWTVSKNDFTGSKNFGFWDTDNDQLELEASLGVHKIELLVEVCGRLSYADSLQWFVDKKGLGPHNNVVFHNAKWSSSKGNINVTGMPFSNSWVSSLTGWREWVRYEEKGAPSFVRSTFFLTMDQISDTFIDTTDWHRGLMFVNGFNLGRYFCAGPQLTLFVPAPLLKVGENSIIIFEHYYNHYSIDLTTDPVYM